MPNGSRGSSEAESSLRTSISITSSIFRSLSTVEFAERRSFPAPPPAGPTPDITSRQGYKNDAPEGIGVPAPGNIPGSGGACGQDQLGCGPVEASQSVFDVIQRAASLGRIVLEAAGNGRVDLGGPSCNGAFNRNLRDSGAIIVGAGSATDHSRLGFSSYGSRVDVQGWGEKVATTGYGDAFDLTDETRLYTYRFGGTSSATPSCLPLRFRSMEFATPAVDLSLRPSKCALCWHQPGPRRQIPQAAISARFRTSAPPWPPCPIFVHASMTATLP